MLAEGQSSSSVAKVTAVTAGQNPAEAHALHVFMSLEQRGSEHATPKDDTKYSGEIIRGFGPGGRGIR